MAKKKAAQKATDEATQSDGADQPASGPRMFEYRDGKSDKFWCIEVSGSSHTVRYGRVGTDGQTTTKDFDDAAKAEASAKKLISQKVKKGYAEIADKSESRSETIKLNRAKAQEREPFMREILATPDDPAPYLVFADWLEEQDDPQGEFIRIQWQLEDESVTGSDRKALQKREKALLKEHKREWVGDLADDLVDLKEPEGLRWRGGPPYEWTFARGFLDSLSIDYLYPDFAKRLIKSPAAQTLRRLVIRDPSDGDALTELPEYQDKDWDYEDTPGLDALIGGKFPNVRLFEINEQDTCHISAANVHKVVRNMPRLESLELQAHAVSTTDLFKLKLPELRTLVVHHLDQYDLVALANNKSMTKLESINCWPHALEPGDDTAYITFEDFQAICRSKHLTNLKHIRLWSTTIGDDGIRELVNSALLSQLRTLDLTYGSVTEVGANLLAEADLSGLQELNLSDNFLSSESAARLKSVFAAFESGSQYSGDPNDIDDFPEFLCFGDME